MGNDKISFGRKISYGLGAMGGNFMNTLMSAFLLSYYTDSAGIAAAAIGTMFLLTRLLDGVTDFAMGSIVDKTNTKLGKARPWLIICAPLMFIGLILIVSVPESFSEALKLVFAYLTYIFLNCIVYTIYGIAHVALLARMSRDSKERNLATMWAGLLQGISSLVGSAMIMPIVLNFGWTVAGLILGILAGGLILIEGIVCKEQVQNNVPIDDERKISSDVPLKEQIMVTLKNRYFWLALLLGTFALLANANSTASLVYYCNIVLDDPMYMATLSALGMAPAFISMILMGPLSNKFTKRVFLSACVIVMIIGFALMGIAGTNKTLLLIGMMLRSFGINPIFGGIFAFCADATDYGEWKFGVRTEGLMSASSSIGNKIGIGFGSAATAWILAAAGYVGGAESYSNSIVSAIRFDTGWLGVIFGVILLIGMLFMDVEKYLPQINSELKD